MLGPASKRACSRMAACKSLESCPRSAVSCNPRGSPLAIGMGIGSELRKPLGIAIVGGLIVSQILTLYTTPVIYLALDKLRHRRKKRRKDIVDLHPLGWPQFAGPSDG